MKKIVIFGGAGFIGCHAANSAASRGTQVILFDNLSRPGSDLNLAWLRETHGDHISLVREDIRDVDAVAACLSAHADADAILHLAAQVAVTTSVLDPTTDFDINLRGTFNILEAMRACKTATPMLYASTNKVYGGLEDLELKESDDHVELVAFPEGIPESRPLDFHSPYGCSKGGADQYVLDYARIYGLRTIVFRQSCIYGTHQFGVEDQGWVAWFTIAKMMNKPITIYGSGKQVRDILFADDLVAAYWAAFDAIDTTCGEAYNIGGGRHRLSLLQLLDQLEEAFGPGQDLAFEDPRPGDQMIFVSDNRKALRDFGWLPSTSPQEGIQKLINWIRENESSVRSCLAG